MARNGMADAITRALTNATGKMSVAQTVEEAAQRSLPAVGGEGHTPPGLSGSPATTAGDALSAVKAQRINMAQQIKDFLARDLAEATRPMTPIQKFGALGEHASRQSIAARHGQMLPTFDEQMEARGARNFDKALAVGQYLGEEESRKVRTAQELRLQDQYALDLIKSKREAGNYDADRVWTYIERYVPDPADYAKVANHLFQMDEEVNAGNAHRIIPRVAGDMLAQGLISARKQTTSTGRPYPMEHPVTGERIIVTPGDPRIPDFVAQGYEPVSIRGSDGEDDLTLTQQSNNEEIEKNRRHLARLLKEKKLTPSEARRRTKKFLPSGRINTDYDELLAAAIRAATQRKTGPDPEYSAIYDTWHGFGGESGADSEREAILLQQARDALAQGALLSEVERVLRENGVDPGML